MKNIEMKKKKKNEIYIDPATGKAWEFIPGIESKIAGVVSVVSVPVEFLTDLSEVELRQL